MVPKPPWCWDLHQLAGQGDLEGAGRAWSAHTHPFRPSSCSLGFTPAMMVTACPAPRTTFWPPCRCWPPRLPIPGAPWPTVIARTNQAYAAFLRLL